MHLFSCYGAHYRTRFVAIATLALPLVQASGQQIDTAQALSTLRDAQTACTMDGGSLWKRSLCGPIALVDRQTRLVIANDTVVAKHFLRLGDAYVTTLPENQYVANTSFPWGGRTWTMVALPLPKDRYARVTLVMHEVFHREQEALGLRQPDALTISSTCVRAGHGSGSNIAPLPARSKPFPIRREHGITPSRHCSFARSADPSTPAATASRQRSRSRRDYPSTRGNV